MFRDPVRVSELRERAIGLLVENARGDSALLRANALEGLAGAGERAAPAVEAGLKDSNPGVRSVAAILIGRLGLSALSGSVEGLRRDESAFVRAAAVYASVKVGASMDATPLASALFNDASFRVRAHAVYLLGELGNTSAVPMIRQAARAPVPRGQEAAGRLFQLQVAEALVKLGEDDEREAVRAALYPSRPDELEATALAVQIIGQLQDRSAVGDLINLVEYKDKSGNRMPAEVRLAAAAALAKLGQPRGTYIADEFFKSPDPALRAQAAAVYGDLGLGENLGKLQAMLDDESGFVRVSSAAAILRLTGPGGGRAGAGG
jgi:HEAT repeat protein